MIFRSTHSRCAILESLGNTLNDEEDIELSVEFSEKAALFKMMQEVGIEESVMSTMASELKETEDPVHNVLFVATTGRNTIKAIHVPEEALNGHPGPVLFTAANPNVVLAAFSREFIANSSDSVELLPEEEREDAWATFMEELSEMVIFEFEQNPPSKFEEI